MNRVHRVTFGPGAFLLGAGITVTLFGVPLGATGYVFGTAAALLLGMPLALATGILMRPVRDQLLHIVAIAGAGLLTGLLTLLFMAGGGWHTMWGLVLWTGVCAAIGRLAVVRLVTTHNNIEAPSARLRRGISRPASDTRHRRRVPPLTSNICRSTGGSTDRCMTGEQLNPKTCCGV
jgi:hypothetical protein